MPRFAVSVVAIIAAVVVFADRSAVAQIGVEVAVPRHLAEGEE
jgi:hypothetical protein